MIRLKDRLSCGRFRLGKGSVRFNWRFRWVWDGHRGSFLYWGCRCYLFGRSSLLVVFNWAFPYWFLLCRSRFFHRVWDGFLCSVKYKIDFINLVIL